VIQTPRAEFRALILDKIKAVVSGDSLRADATDAVMSLFFDFRDEWEIVDTGTDGVVKALHQRSLVGKIHRQPTSREVIDPHTNSNRTVPNR
jgi:hypothetical protein